MTAAVGVAVCLAPIAYASLRQYPQEWATIAELGTYRERLEALAGLGDYLQANLAGPAMFYTPPALIDYVPGLSSKSKVIYFRDIYSKPYTVDPVEIDLISSPAAAVTSAERMNLLDRYGIEYILTEDPAVERYYAGLPQAFSSREDHRFWIIRYLGASNLGN